MQVPHATSDAVIYDDNWETETLDVSKEFNCVDWWHNTWGDLHKKHLPHLRSLGSFSQHVDIASYSWLAI
jgi:hypothetical protein